MNLYQCFFFFDMESSILINYLTDIFLFCQKVELEIFNVKNGHDF
jgi:hypothetical protein